MTNMASRRVAWFAGAITMASGLTVAAQLMTVPIRMELSTPTKEVNAGASVTIRATLENIRNQPTVALEDVPVTLILPATGKQANLVIPKGQSSAQLSVTLVGAGLTKLQATAPKLPPSFLLIVVNSPPSRTSSPSAATPSSAAPPPMRRGGALGRAGAPPMTSESAGETAQKHAAKPSAPPTAVIPPATATTLPKVDLQVVPDEIDPVGRSWTAAVGLALLGPNGQPLAAGNELPIRLSARFGHVSPSVATIHRGQIAVTDDVSLVADRPGTDTIAALSAFGTVEKRLVFNAPLPAKLRVEVNPPDVINDGRSEIIVSVLLLDGDNHPTPTPDRPLCATVSASLGDLRERTICIDAGNFSKETMLTSTRHGEARIIARAVGLEEASTTARFLFPWLLVIVSTVGGIVGSFLRSGQLWARHLRRNLAVAATLGFLFYVLVLFGAIGAIRKLPFEIGKIAAINELGAFALGIIGGYYGLIWLKPDAEPRLRRHGSVDHGKHT
jgi:hypothetical protein